MVADPEIIQAVPGTKNKASTYNTNFANMVQYVKDSMTESETYIQDQLTTYAEVNTLDNTQSTLEIESNKVYNITPEEDIAFTLPTITETGNYYQILVQLNMPTVYTIDLGTTYCFNGIEPDLSMTGNYDIIYTYDNAVAKWCVGAIFKGDVE